MVLDNKVAFEALYHVYKQNCIKGKVNFEDIIGLAHQILNDQYEIELDAQTAFIINQMIFNSYYSNEDYEAIEKKLCKGLAELELSKNDYDVYFEMIDSSKDYLYLVPSNNKKVISEFIYNYHTKTLMNVERYLPEEDIIMLEKINKDKINSQSIENLIDQEMKI